MERREIAPLTKRIQNAGTGSGWKQKQGGGSCNTFYGSSGCTFYARSLVKGLSGETVVECTYVEGDGKYAVSLLNLYV